ncbi:MAG: hypothetical protein U0Q22_13900 [Acidimicrobiales bacterium]
MNNLSDLRAVLDDRAGNADAVRPDLGAVRTRARHKRRSRQTVLATATATAVGLGGWAVHSAGSGERRVTTTDQRASAPPATAVLVQAPLTEVRALPDGATLTARVTAPLPTYGPYGSDHLWYPPAMCPVDARVNLKEPTDPPASEGGSTGLQLPITSANDERTAYWYWSSAGSPSDRGDVTAMVLVPGTAAGERYRLMSDGTALDETTADGSLTLLAGRLGTVGLPSLPSLEMDLQRIDADGRVLETLHPQLLQADAVSECEAVNQPVELGPSSPPADVTTAEAAVRAATTTLASSSVALGANQSITPLEVHWTSPTSAWVKYRVVYFAATAENGGQDLGPLMWAEITSDGASWSPTAEARCNYARSRGTGDTCPELPQTQAAG